MHQRAKPFLGLWRAAFKLRLMKVKIVILLSLILLPVLSVGQPITVGERLEFKLKYGILAAGNSHMEVAALDTVHGHITYRIENRTRSSGLVDAFYKVRDRMTSWIDTSSLATIRFEKKLREGDYRKDYSVWFDYEKMKAYSSDDTLDIDTKMHDVLSLFYYIRSVDLSVGDTLKMKTYDNDKISPFYLHVDEASRKEVAAGTYMCLTLIPFSESGSLFKYEGEGQMWVTDDQHKMLVYVKSKASFGSIILELEKYIPGEDE